MKSDRTLQHLILFMLAVWMVMLATVGASWQLSQHMSIASNAGTSDKQLAYWVKEEATDIEVLDLRRKLRRVL